MCVAIPLAGILAAIVIPAYQNYIKRAAAATAPSVATKPPNIVDPFAPGYKPPDATSEPDVFSKYGLTPPASAAAGSFQDGMAAHGRGEFANALAIFRPLAVQGDSSAQNNLGVMYNYGQGTAQDKAEAIKWYRLAAAQGNAGAQNNLGLMYESGQGTAQDFVRAYMWFNLGAVAVEVSGTNRDSVAKRMTPQQVAQAQELARECKSRNFNGCGQTITPATARQAALPTPKVDRQQRVNGIWVDPPETPRCVYKSVMTDDDYKACGAEPPQAH